MTTRLTPLLMFVGNAEEALNLYVSVLGGTVDALERHSAEMGEQEGKIAAASITVRGQSLRVFDSPPVHAFSFTPAISLFLQVDSADEVDAIFAALSEGGQDLMPLSSDYPFAQRFGWCNDRFGVSWQICFT